MFVIAVGHSTAADMEICATALVAQTTAQLHGETPHAALLFSTFGLDHATLLRELKRQWPDCSIVGGSSYGEVSRALGYRLGSSLLILFASDTIEIRTGVLRNLRGDDELAQADSIERQLGHLRAPSEQPALGLLLPDGLGVDGTSVVRNIANVLPKTPLFGGSTAENLQNQRTLQFFETEILEHAVPYLLFFGPLRFSWSVTQGLSAGWDPVSERLDAVCEGRFIRTIEGEPVFDYLTTRYPVEGRDWSYVHPFAIYPDRASDDHLLCDVIRFDTATGMLECAQSLPSLCQIQLTEPDPPAIVRAARRNLLQTLANDAELTPAAGVLWFSCVNRALVLEKDPADEYRAATEGLVTQMPIVGFQTYGEIAPRGPAGDPFYYSCTLVTLLLGEVPRPTGLAADAASAISTANLKLRNQALAESLKAAQDELEQLRLKLSESESVARLTMHGRTEQRLRYRALALDLLCEILDSRFNDVRRVAIKGDALRLNKSGLARLIDEQHRRRHDAPFPLTIAQLARLLSPGMDQE
ncbi:FIST signal transduction protein [Thiocapsa imhoffii]|nr:FIST N-terminal domain-containing protein [Thiocapsa imhoffii]